jgi:hypothetical protein
MIKIYAPFQGSDMGGLRIGQGLEGLQRDLRILEEVWGDRGPEWRTILVDIQTVTENFQLFIDGIVGRSYLSDVAIDAIRILESMILRFCFKKML